MDIGKTVGDFIRDAAIFLGFITVISIAFNPDIEHGIDNQGNTYIILELENGFTNDISRLTKNSTSISFTYTISIYKRNNLRSIKVVDKNVLFDSLKEQYILTRNGEVELTKSIRRVENFLSHLTYVIQDNTVKTIVVEAAISLPGQEGSVLEKELWGKSSPIITISYPLENN